MDLSAALYFVHAISCECLGVPHERAGFQEVTARMSATANNWPGRKWVLRGLLCGACGAYLGLHLRNGWLPWDEGSIAVTAERVLLGGLPHRDFPDLYTGGLSFLNALAFRTLGTDLLSPRIVLLLAFVVWLAVLYELCSRFMPESWSAVVVVLATVWSAPNYPAAVPSWYNLFLATAGLLAIVAYSDGNRLRWIWVAGICAGLSISVKIVGLFFVLGAFLFLVFDEQTSSRCAAPGTGSKAYSLLLLLFSTVVLLLVAQFVLRVGGAPQVLRFVVPLGSLLSVLAFEEWRGRQRSLGGTARFARTLTPTVLFFAGMFTPLLFLTLPYALSGTTGNLLHGVFIRPTTRLEYASQPAPPILTVVFTLAVIVVLGLGLRVRPALRWVHHATLAVLGFVVLVAAQSTWGAYMFVWLSAYNLAPIVVVAGSVWVVLTSAADGDRRRMFALLSVTVGVGMVEFPHSSSIYFHYTAALVILTLVALVWQVCAERSSRPALLIPVAFYLVFGLALMNPHPPGTGGPRVAGQRWAELALPRARLRSSPSDSLAYGELVRIIRTLGDREVGYAGPDSPEVYFLTGSMSSEPVLFDFLRGKAQHPLADTSLLDGFDVVVLNRNPEFSSPLAPSILERVENQYPFSQVSGDFEVRWRN
jgi:hypothetical protein